MDKVLNEIDGMMRFYGVGMENAKRCKNYEKYYQFEEAYEALSILRNQLIENERAA